MSDKNRWRKVDKARYEKNLKNKKRRLEHRAIRAVSREKRTFIRRSIAPYYESFRNLTERHLLFILKETDNMEKILLQRFDLGKNNTLLALPRITDDMLEEYLEAKESVQDVKSTTLTVLDETAIKDIIKYFYGIEFQEMTNTPLNFSYFKGCRFSNLNSNLVKINVRPYDKLTWFTEEFTSLREGLRIYSGNKLKTFFQIKENLGKTFVFHDTLMELMAYRGMVGKLNFEEVKTDAAVLSKRQFLGGGMFYLTLTRDEDEIYERFKNEKKESSQLDGSYRKKSDDKNR